MALENGLEICVEDEHREDIEIFGCKKLKNGIKDKDLARNLQADILQRSQNVFQWVVHVFSQVILLYKKGKSWKFIRKAFQKTPIELNELYQQLLQGIDDNDKRQSLQLMQ